MKNKTALITGCTGQSGSYLAEHLLTKQYKVYGLKRRTSVGGLERIAHLMKESQFELVDGDITDAGNINRLIRNLLPDKLFNLAAQSQVRVSFEEPAHTWDTNARGVLNILEAIKDESPRTRFYQASTSEMFGSSFTEEIHPDNSVTKFQNENTVFLPQSPYAIAKLAAHHFTQLYRKSYGIFACCGILFNHESPRRGETFLTRKVTKYIGKLARECDFVMCYDGAFGEPTVFSPEGFGHMRYDEEKLKNYPKLKLGNLLAYRDWGHAKDYVRAMDLMLDYTIPDDYVVGTGKSYKVQDFVEKAFRAVGLDYKHFVEIDTNLFRPAEVDFLHCDATKVKKVLGWSPHYDFSELVGEMVYEDLQNA